MRPEGLFGMEDQAHLPAVILEQYFVGHGLHEEQTAASLLQEILACPRIGRGFGIEPFSFVLYSHFDALVHRFQPEMDLLRRIEPVSMLDRIGNGLDSQKNDIIGKLFIAHAFFEKGFRFGDNPFDARPVAGEHPFHYAWIQRLVMHGITGDPFNSFPAQYR